MYFKLSRVCSLRCVFFQFSSKKIYWLRDICYYLCNWNFTLWKGLKFVMRHYFDMWTCEQFSLLAVRKMFCHFQRPINGFIAVDLFFCFFVYSICGEASFHDDVKSDDEYFMANCSDCGEWYHKKCINIQVKVFEIGNTTCNGNALFAENKLRKFRPKTISFCCFTTRLPRNLFQFHKFLVQSQNVIGKNF